MPEEWKENFRMRKENFLKLCAELRPFIEKQVTNTREPVEVDKQVAATLYYLSDEGRLRKTANAFGLSRSSVSIIIRRVTHAITVHLGPNYITVPLTEDAVKDNVTNFFYCFFHPSMLGCIYSLTAPEGQGRDRVRRRTLKKGRSWRPFLEGQAGPTGISRFGRATSR